MPRNDITPIGDGSVGIDSSITDTSAKQIQEAVSEQNLKWQLGVNSSMKGIYNAVLSMVSRWSAADKINLIVAYGDPSRISKTPSDDELNQALATILISRMRKEDLKKILGEQESQAKNLLRDVRNIETSTTNKNKRYFSLKDLNNVYNRTGKMSANDKQLLKGLKRDFNIDIPRIYRKEALPNLRKELTSLLSGYNKMEIAKIANRLGISFEDGIAEKNLITQIINKVNLYAALLLGRQRGIRNIGMSQEELDGIEDLLSYTSFAWLTGKPVLSTFDFAQKRIAAKNAKKIMAANKKNLRERLSVTKGSKIDRNGNRKPKFFSFRSKARTESARGLGRMIFSSSLLSNLTDDDFVSIAERMGIPDIDKMNIDQIKSEVYMMVGSEEEGIKSSLTDLIALSAKPASGIKFISKRRQKKKNEIIERIKQQRAAGFLKNIIKDSAAASQEYSDKIPVVSINESGKISSEAILKAVPVINVGDIHAGRIQSRKEADEAKNALNLGTNTKYKKLEPYLNSLLLNVNTRHFGRRRNGKFLFDVNDKNNKFPFSLDDLKTINDRGVALNNRNNETINSINNQTDILTQILNASKNTNNTINATIPSQFGLLGKTLTKFYNNFNAEENVPQSWYDLVKNKSNTPSDKQQKYYDSLKGKSNIKL